MTKMNKKGFTLIEMLVVIAIIAVLVSIIIPTVTSATDKAAAATNAANLRSVKAELTTKMLTGDTTATHNLSITKEGVVSGEISGITFKDVTGAAGVNGCTKCTSTAAAGFSTKVVNKELIVNYNKICIDCWAALAG